MTQPKASEAIAILADGFFDNPVLGRVFPDDSTREPALTAWFRFWLDGYGDRAEVVVSEPGDAAAVWAPPDTPELTGPQVEELFAIIRRHNPEGAGDVLARLATLKVPSEPHWYLNAIAVRRGVRSRGAGARLLEPFLERADGEGIPVYLESSNPRNLGFYRRYGFSECGPCVALDDEDARLQPMWRAVRGS